MNRKFQIVLGHLVLAIWMGTGLSGTVSAKDEPNEDEPLFYPDPPNLPRLQFLAAYANELDVSTSSGSSFRDFVFGGRDKEGSFIEKPYGVAMHKGAIYVVDARGNGWGVFDVANGRAYFVRPSGGGALTKPINITIDTDGTKYVTDTDRQQIVVYTADDKYVTAFGEPGQFKPVDVAILDNRLYVTDVLHHKVHVLDKSSGDSLFTFGEAGSKPGQLFHPTNLAVAPDNTIYVVDTTNFRVQKFTEEGQFVSEFGGQGAVPGRFTRPKGIAIDADNYVYVTDSAFNKVQILEESGGALMFFGGPSTAPDSIDMLTVVKIDYENVKYFQHMAAPGFEVEYLVLLSGQYATNKVVVYGFGSFAE